MMMNGVKHYVKYSVNKYINNLKKKLFICEVAIYIYIKWDVRNVGTSPKHFFWANVPGKVSC